MLFNSEARLRELLPNIQMTAKGEVSIFKKMEPFLQQAEEQLKVFTGIKDIPGDLPSDLLPFFERAVAYSAMADAAPSLDCVLTPNGFAVVYNQSMLPTAKLGSENPATKMIKALRKNAFLTEVMIVEDLIKLNEKGWIESYSAKKFLSVIYPSEVAAFYACESWSDFFNVKQSIDTAELILAEKYVGTEFIDHLRKRTLSAPKFSVNVVLDKTRIFVRAFVDTKFIDSAVAFSLISYMKDNQQDFPEWTRSEVGKMHLNPPDFSNEINSSGYFF